MLRIFQSAILLEVIESIVEVVRAPATDLLLEHRLLEIVNLLHVVYDVIVRCALFAQLSMERLAIYG